MFIQKAAEFAGYHQVSRVQIGAVQMLIRVQVCQQRNPTVWSLLSLCDKFCFDDKFGLAKRWHFVITC